MQAEETRSLKAPGFILDILVLRLFWCERLKVLLYFSTLTLNIALLLLLFLFHGIHSPKTGLFPLNLEESKVLL